MASSKPRALSASSGSLNVTVSVLNRALLSTSSTIPIGESATTLGGVMSALEPWNSKAPMS